MGESQRIEARRAARGHAERSDQPGWLLRHSTAEAATDGAAPPSADAALAGQGPLPAVQSGVALGMTECQIVQRTGAPDTFNIGAEGTERVTTVTVMRGTWPGLYRFRGGPAGLDRTRRSAGGATDRESSQGQEAGAQAVVGRCAAPSNRALFTT